MSPHDRPQTSTDYAVLTEAYGTHRPLAARQRLYDHQTPQYDLPGLSLEVAGDRVGIWADVGCGDGRYTQRIRSQRPDIHVVGLDLSQHLLTGLGGAVACADAARLPLQSQSMQVVLMMHMLYHVDDPLQAIAEAARVLTPGGVLIASTNARTDKRELDQWWAEAAAEVLQTPTGPKRIKLSDRFPAEDAPTLVKTHFDEAAKIELSGVIEVETPDPVLAHYASYQAWAHQAEVPFHPTLERVAHNLRRRLTQGPLKINTSQALIVGRGPRNTPREAL